jgi:hypothetical protein
MPFRGEIQGDILHLKGSDLNMGRMACPHKIGPRFLSARRPEASPRDTPNVQKKGHDKTSILLAKLGTSLALAFREARRKT